MSARAVVALRTSGSHSPHEEQDDSFGQLGGVGGRCGRFVAQSVQGGRDWREGEDLIDPCPGLIGSHRRRFRRLALRPWKWTPISSSIVGSFEACLATCSGSMYTTGVLGVGALPTPHSARSAELRLDGENWERSTPRGQRLTLRKSFECNMALVEGEGQRVMSVLASQRGGRLAASRRLTWSRAIVGISTIRARAMAFRTTWHTWRGCWDVS